METATIKVEGMTCGSCVNSVSKALKRVPGVDDVQVDLASGTATVTGEQAARSVPALLAALSDAGYEASTSPEQGSAAARGQASCHSPAAGAHKGHGGGCCCG